MRERRQEKTKQTVYFEKYLYGHLFFGSPLRTIKTLTDIKITIPYDYSLLYTPSLPFLYSLPPLLTFQTAPKAPLPSSSQYSNSLGGINLSSPCTPSRNSWISRLSVLSSSPRAAASCSLKFLRTKAGDGLGSAVAARG
jgi:hypothetical protein